MSYSRWSSSRWYTYWRSMKGPENYNNAIFEISGLFEGNVSFQAAEIRKNVDDCVERAALQSGGATLEEKQELKGYMLQFLYDVDERYPRRRT